MPAAIPDDLGSVMDEAARLAGLLGGLITPTAGSYAAPRPPTPASAPAPAPAPPPASRGEHASSAHDRGDHPGEAKQSDCDFCPICQGISMVRRLSPDVIARAADVADLIATGLREWGDRQRDAASRHRPSDGPGHAAGDTVGHDGDGATASEGSGAADEQCAGDRDGDESAFGERERDGNEHDHRPGHRRHQDQRRAGHCGRSDRQAGAP